MHEAADEIDTSQEEVFNKVVQSMNACRENNVSHFEAKNCQNIVASKISKLKISAF